MLINILGITWLLYHYDSFLDVFNMVLKNKKKIILIPKIILSCFKCSTFWTSLVITGGNIPLSACISFLGYLIDKYLINTEIKL